MILDVQEAYKQQILCTPKTLTGGFLSSTFVIRLAGTSWKANIDLIVASLVASFLTGKFTIFGPQIQPIGELYADQICRWTHLVD